VQTRQSARDQFQNSGRNFFFAEIDIFGAERFGNCAIEAVFINETAVYHRLDHGFAVYVRFIQNVFGLRWLQDLLFNKKLGDLFLVHR